MISDEERTTLDLVEHPVFVLEPDQDGEPVYVAFNRFGLKLLGQPQDAVLGRTARDVYPGAHGDAAYRHHKETLRSAKRRAYDFVLPLETGSHRVLTTLTPVMDGSGRVLRIVGISQADEVPLASSAAQTEQEADLREMEDMVSLAAHDLRSPMLRMQSITGMLREEIGDQSPDVQEDLAMLEQVNARALQLISDVLSQAYATGTVQDIGTFDLVEMVANIMSMLDPDGHCRWSSDQVRLNGDRSAVQVILRNLIDNAIKHADQSNDADADTSLELEISASGDASGAFAITVADNGKGFSDPALLFMGGARFSIGSGFGLLGVRRLIRARGGTLSATNRETGQGAVVTFTLPGRVIGVS